MTARTQTAHWVALIAFAFVAMLFVTHSNPSQWILGQPPAQTLPSFEFHSERDAEHDGNRLDSIFESLVPHSPEQDSDGDGCSDREEGERCKNVPNAKLLPNVRPPWCVNVKDPDHCIPGADEVCDGIDNDCINGTDTYPVVGPIYYCDSDGDGYGSDDRWSGWRYLCKPKSNFNTQIPGDCHDIPLGESVMEIDSVYFSDIPRDGTSDASFEVDGAEFNPAAIEFYDGLDNNCDGRVDNEPDEDKLDTLCNDNNDCTNDYLSEDYTPDYLKLEFICLNLSSREGWKCGPGDQGTCQNGSCVPFD